MTKETKTSKVELTKLKIMAKVLEQFINPVLSDIKQSEIDALKNTQHNETRLLLLLMQSVYSADTIPQELRTILVKLIQLIAIKSEKDEKLRETISNIITEIKKY